MPVSCDWKNRDDVKLKYSFPSAESAVEGAMEKQDRRRQGQQRFGCFDVESPTLLRET